jgi:hypothetical protein
MPTEFLPPPKARQWSRLDDTSAALHEGQNLIPEAVVPESAVCLVDRAWLRDGFFEQALPG